MGKNGLKVVKMGTEGGEIGFKIKQNGLQWQK